MLRNGDYLVTLALGWQELPIGEPVDLQQLLGGKVNAVELAFLSNQPATTSFSLDLKLKREEGYGPLVPVYNNSMAAVGSEACIVHPLTGETVDYRWANVLNGSDFWYGITMINSGIPRLLFDLRGYRYLQAMTSLASGQLLILISGY